MVGPTSVYIKAGPSITHARCYYSCKKVIIAAKLCSPAPPFLSTHCLHGTMQSATRHASPLLEVQNPPNPQDSLAVAVDLASRNVNLAVRVDLRVATCRHAYSSAPEDKGFNSPWRIEGSFEASLQQAPVAPSIPASHDQFGINLSIIKTLSPQAYRTYRAAN